MAHFAEIGDGGLVLRVLSVPDGEEHRGQEFLSEDCVFGGIWIQTSYTSRGGKRYNPDTNEPVSDAHLRFNYAGAGFRYDPDLDAFIPPQPDPAWTFNSETCLWDPPVESEEE